MSWGWVQRARGRELNAAANSEQVGIKEREKEEFLPVATSEVAPLPSGLSRCTWMRLAVR